MKIKTLLICCLLIPTIASAQSNPESSQSPKTNPAQNQAPRDPATEPAATPGGPPVESAVTKHARQQGVKKCIQALDSLVKFVNDDERFGFLDSWNQKADDGMFNSLQIRRYADGVGMASIGVAPSAAGTCDSVVTSVFFFPDTSCGFVKDKVFTKWTFFTDLNGVSIYNDEDPKALTSKVALAPIANGCMILKNAMLLHPIK